jgi:hypothetical protein
MTKNLPNESLTESTRDRVNSSLSDPLNPNDSLNSSERELINKQPKDMAEEAVPDSEIDDGGWLCL